MKIEDRDDLELFEHTDPDGKVYQFRMLDCNIKPDGKEGFYCQFPVYEKETHSLLFVANFRLKPDEIDRVLFKTYDQIDKFIKKKVM